MTSPPARPPAGSAADVNTVRHAELVLPADSAYVSVLRMTSVGLAARLDFTLDDTEDLRMAVGEACALALDGSHGESLQAVFAMHEGMLRVTITTSSEDDYEPDHADFGLQVLTAITSDVEISAAEGRRMIGFTVRSSVPD